MITVGKYVIKFLLKVQEIMLLVEVMMVDGLFGKKELVDWLKCLLAMKLVSLL